MDAFFKSPRVLFQKTIATLLIGAGYLIVGIAVFIFSADKITLVLSGIVMLLSASRAYGLYRKIVKNEFEVIEGTCVRVVSKPFSKFSTIKVMDNDGNETTLRLGKQSKLKIGSVYRFYFNTTERISVGSEYFDTALSSNSFLGFEELSNFPDFAGEDISKNPHKNP